jgi:hypothetical protein
MGLIFLCFMKLLRLFVHSVMRCSKLFTILWVLGSTWHGLVARRFSFSLSPFHFVLHSTARMGGREFHSLI